MNTENQIISGIFHNSMDAILVTSPDGKILKANKAAVELFGYSEEEIIQLGRSGLVDLSDPRLPFLLEARRQHGQARGELYFIRKDGSRFEGEVASSVFREKEGNERTVMIIRDITPRKVAEDKLRESEERFRTLFRDNLSVMLLIDAETGDITDANDSALKYYGWTYKEMTSRRIHDINLLGEASSDELKKAREKSQVHFEFRHRLADGSVRDIEAFASRIVIQGRDYMHSIILDITERKKNEQLMTLQLEELRRKQEALKESEHKYRLLAENAGDVIFTMDRDFRFTYVSPAVTPLLGYTPEEVLMLNVSDILTPESLKIARKAVAGIKTDLPFDEMVAENTFEMAMIRRDSSVVWTELKGSLIIDEGRWVSGILCVIRDISERKRTMDEMLKLSRALEQNPASIVITDKEGIIDYVNPKFTELTGYTLDEAKGQNPRILKSGYTTDEDYRKLWETISGGHEWKGEFRNKRKDGSLYWEQATISPVWNTAGEISYYLAIKEDITEKKRIIQELVTARDRAEESDRLKTAFLHNISHEIRTPLNAIVGFSSLLNIPDLAADKKREFANIINSSNEQLLSIITGIINLATLEAGQDKISEKQVNLNQLLANVNRQFNVKRQPSAVTLSFHPSLPDGSSCIITDPVKLTQILVNLVGNALKFTHKGYVRYGYVVKGDWLNFYVEDTGIGIEPEMQNVIFQRFRQIDNTATRRYGGAGLGLAITKGYVELLGGSVRVVSEKGHGSVFSFTIPYKRAVEKCPEGIKEAEAANARFPNGKTILVAEDEDYNYRLVEEYLKTVSLNVIRANDGLETVNLCVGDNLPHLVLMDIKMPVMDGIAATKIIKEKNPDLPVIALTAFALESDRKRIMKNGFDGYIEKPVNEKSLYDIISRYLL